MPQGYNPPVHFPMLMGQWMHQMFLDCVITYDQYVKIQNRFYSMLN